MVTASGSSWTEPEIENGTVTITLPDDENIGRYKARQVLWAARPLAPSANEFKAYKGDHLIASFASEAIDRWQAASDAEQPLLMIEALYESEVRRGADEQDTLRNAIATCSRFTINEPLSTPPKRAGSECSKTDSTRSVGWPRDTTPGQTGSCLSRWARSEARASRSSSPLGVRTTVVGLVCRPAHLRGGLISIRGR